MSETTYCLDSDVVIWHLRKGERQLAVDALLEKLATTGTLACSVLTIAEVEQGMRKGEEEKTRGFLRPLKSYRLTVTLRNERASWFATFALADSPLASRTRLSPQRASFTG
jgi:predicted nucleic acid-binding protein